MLARDAVARAPGAFAAAGALRAASEALQAAVDAETAADGADAVTHADWRAAHDRLLAAGAALPPQDGAAARVRALLQRWSDPYAADATGADLLDLVAHALGPGPGHADLRAALAGARRAGRARDRAEAARAEAVATRVAATHRWRAAADALLAAAPTADRGTLAALGGVATPDPSLDWFEE